MPCKGPISSYFGYRQAPKAGASTGHKGIDIACPIGTKVNAIADGTAYVKSDPNGYGIYIGIDHGIINGKHVISRYAHLSQCCILNGHSVKQGQVIALSGNTGNSTGPHLHFEIRIDDVPVNPLNYVKH
ncbi:M23 family metallopeptidase [bacterium]|nr:M23 family metallopeptidase [bacterium]